LIPKINGEFNGIINKKMRIASNNIDKRSGIVEVLRAFLPSSEQNIAISTFKSS